jgi:vacuolar-type H+-ATPase subunit H
MENEKTLDHLLKIEAEAAGLVNDAQAEADRRIHENEEKNRVAYEEHFRAEAEKYESSLNKEKDSLKNQYQKALENYQKEISGINADEKSFITLFNKFLAEV